MPETQISNNELERRFNQRFDEHAKIFSQHEIADATTFAEMSKQMANLATKDDIKDMKEAFEDIVNTIKIFKAGSKWSYRILIVLASIVAALAGIIGGFKIIFK